MRLRTLNKNEIKNEDVGGEEVIKNKMKGGRRKAWEYSLEEKQRETEDKMYLKCLCNFRIFIGQIVVAPKNALIPD